MRTFFCQCGGGRCDATTCDGCCDAQRRCVIGTGECTPDCRLTGATCLGGTACLPNGRCAGGVLVSYCQSI